MKAGPGWPQGIFQKITTPTELLAVFRFGNMAGSQPTMWPDNLDWQMTALFLLALTLMVFLMKFIALLWPTATPVALPIFSWVFPSPDSIRRSPSAVRPQPVVLRFLMLLGAVSLSYWVYDQLVRAFQIRGTLLSYLATPILLLVSETLVALANFILLPGRRSLPALHQRPWCARGVADFWGNRWNLWFSDWFRYTLLQRLRRRPVGALFLVFAVSGLMHEWVINVPLYWLTGRMLFGTMMIFFLAQAVGIQVERRLFRRRPHLRRAFVWLVVFLLSPLVLNEGLLRTLHLWPG